MPEKILWRQPQLVDQLTEFQSSSEAGSCSPERYPTKRRPDKISGGILAGLSDFTHASVRHYEKQRRSDGAARRVS